MDVTLAGIVMEVRLGVDWNAEAPIVVSVLVPEKTTEVMDELAKPGEAIDVTPAGMTTAPTHLVWPVTTFSKMVNEPEVLQSTVPLVLSYVPAAWAGAKGKPLETTATKTAALKDLSKVILPFERISSLFGDETAGLENFMSSQCQDPTNSFSPGHNNDHSHMVIDHCCSLFTAASTRGLGRRCGCGH